MKKSLLFSGLIIALTLLCCYALIAADAVNKKKDSVATIKKAAGVEKDISVSLSNHAVLPQQAPATRPMPENAALTSETVATTSDVPSNQAAPLRRVPVMAGPIPETAGLSSEAVAGTSDRPAGGHLDEFTECPENTLFVQAVHMPDESWTAGNSEQSEGYLRYENFSGVTGEICDIHFWGLSIRVNGDWNECDEDPMDFEIKFYQDNAGSPGAEVCTYYVTLYRQETGLLYHSVYQFPLYYWSATLDPCCSITNGWVSIQGTSVGDPNCWFMWMSSGVGDGMSLFEDGGWWTIEDFDLSLCLTGEAEMFGACCDPATGNCEDDVPASQCLPPNIFYPNQTCAEIDCSPECVVECPAGGIAEGEPCPNDPDNYNAGCNSSPPTFSPINCGDVICGSGWAEGGTRDTDWYEIVLTEVTEVTWCGIAEFDLQLAIINGILGCDDMEAVANQYTTDCDTLCLTATLLPGTYWFFVAPEFFDGVPCGDYVAWLTCGESQCTPDFHVDLDCATGYTSGIQSTCNAGDDCNTRPSQDHIYEVVIPEDSRYHFTLCNSPGAPNAWDSYMYVDEICCGATHAALGDDGCNGAGFSDIPCVFLTAGTYYVLIEGYTSSCCGEYILDITCCCPEGITDYCANPIITGPGVEGPVGTWTFGPHTENSCCATDPVECVWWEECGVDPCFTSGFDVVYQFTIETENHLVITASGPCDNQVMVFTDCNDPVGTCEATADRTLTGEDEVIDVTLAGGTYYVSTSCFGLNRCDDITLTIVSDCPLPVELTSLEAIAGDRQVTLNWTTATEQDNDHFDVQRSTDNNWITIAQVDGAGNSQTAINYEYADRAVVNGVTYAYRLVSRDINGTVHEYEQTVEATPSAPMPMEYALDQNYPNPFNPNTSISYALKEAGFVTLKIYNMLGQEVATLVERELTAGRYTATFTAKDLPSGVYVYRLEVNDFSAQKKMILLK